MESNGGRCKISSALHSFLPNISMHFHTHVCTHTHGKIKAKSLSDSTSFILAFGKLRQNDHEFAGILDLKPKEKHKDKFADIRNTY